MHRNRANGDGASAGLPPRIGPRVSAPLSRVARSLSGLAVVIAATFPLCAEAQTGPPAVAVGTVDTVFIRDAAGAGAAAGAATLADLLAGRLPWLVVTRTSGIAGEAATLSLPEPAWGAARVVVYVDGVRLDDVPLPLLEDRVVDPFLEIDPELVERVELVRGPLAAGRYGPEAAGGVLLVTTRALAGGSGLRQELSGTLGMVSPGTAFEPTWHTCPGTDPVAECEGAATGEVVTADGLGQSGLPDTRPLQKLNWLVGYTRGAWAVQGAVAGARRRGAFAGEGFERLAVQLSGSAEPRPGLRISAAGARMEGDVSVDRDIRWDLYCRTVAWPDPVGGICTTGSEPPPVGDGPTRGYERAAIRASATVSHSPFPWLEHRLVATHRTLEDDARWRAPGFDFGLAGYDGRIEQYSRSWEYRVTSGVRFGGGRQWSLGTEAAAWQDYRFRKVRHSNWLAPSPSDTLRGGSERGAREKRSRVRFAAELGWKDRGFLRGALVHQSDGLPLRSFRDSTDHHVLPSASLEYRWPAVRVHAAWGRSRTNPFFDAGWDRNDDAPVALSGLFTTLEGGAAATLAGGRARIGLTASRTDATVEYFGLPTYDARTTAIEVRLDGTVLETAAYGWEAGASLLAMDGRVAEKTDLIIVDDLGGIRVAMIGGERPGSFFSRVVVDVDTVAGVAEVSDLQAVGHLTPDLEGAFRTAFTTGPLRLDAALHLRRGNTVMNWAELRRDFEGTSQAANDTDLSTAERIRRFGPFGDPDGCIGCPLPGNYLVDGSFVRLRLLALTLNLPDRVAGVALPPGEMTLAGRDLWTIAGYAGPDPEAHPLAPPTPRVLVLRLSLGAGR